MSENLAGKTLKKHYYLEKKIDSGGFGDIYLAKDTFSAIGGNYIVKHFSPKYDNSVQLETAMRLFQQESNSLQKLGNHPQIPRIYDFFEEEGNFYLVQEFIEGKTLRQELTESKIFNPFQVFNLLTDILELLKFVHQSGYIHRDIKPSNLIINRFNNKIFLIDFGVVKETIDPQNIDEQGGFLPTVCVLSPGYTPDEQFHGRPKHCSDIYALGMVAIQAMTGEHPKDLERNGELKLVWRNFLPANSNYEPYFLDIIDKMVEQKWQQRYQYASAILSDLAELNSAFNPTAEEITFIPQVPTPAEEFLDNKPHKPQSLKKIKSLAAIGVVSAIAIPFLLFITKSRFNNFVTYENEYIQVEYPENWSRETTNNFLNTSVIFISPLENEADLFRERVAVIVEESSRPMSLARHTSNAVKRIEKLDNFILSPPKETTLGRSDGQYVVYQGTDRDRLVKRQEVWTVNYKQIYTVIYTAEPDKFDKYLPQVEKMIDSLEIIQ